VIADGSRRLDMTALNYQSAYIDETRRGTSPSIVRQG
jgi:hypothetical protein